MPTKVADLERGRQIYFGDLFGLHRLSIHRDRD
jgi:hypothetical protein